MPRQLTTPRIKIPNFGVLTCLTFNDIPLAEVAINASAFLHMLQAWDDYEKARKRPDRTTRAAIVTLRRKAEKLKACFVAEVPIARRARIVPLHNRDDLKSNIE